MFPTWVLRNFEKKTSRCLWKINFSRWLERKWCEVWSRRDLNQTCSPRQDLSNDVSHSQFGGREEVDSWLLVVGSQTASLTPGPSFAHNLGYRCSNDQCEAIFYIYASRPFQWHQEHLNARCFGPCCRALNIRESRRTPNPHFFQVLGFTPTLGQSRVATMVLVKNVIATTIGDWFLQAQPYTIFSKAIDEGVRTQLLKLHTKLMGNQALVKEVQSY
jgi:hypothetical protein